jgi:hypothetical protein
MSNRYALKLSATVARQHFLDAENLAGLKIEEAAFVGRDVVCDR